MISAFGPQPRTVVRPGPSPVPTDATLRRLRLAVGGDADDAADGEDDPTDATLIRVPKPDDDGEDGDGDADGEEDATRDDGED